MKRKLLLLLLAVVLAACAVGIAACDFGSGTDTGGGSDTEQGDNEQGGTGQGGEEDPPQQTDDGHAILSAGSFVWSDATTLTYDGTLRNATETFDLNGQFTVSDGATWRAFTDEECSQSAEIEAKIARLAPGWNDIYVLVQSSSADGQTVYRLRVYRNALFEVSVYYNDTVLYKTATLEENVPVSDAANAAALAFSLPGYTSDGKYYTDATYRTEWSAAAAQSAAVYLYTEFSGVETSGSSVTGMEEQPGNVRLAIPSAAENGTPLTAIAENAFSGQTNILSVRIPDSIQTIGDSAFENCTALTSVTVGSGVESIGNSAFRACSALTGVTIGSGVKSIEDYAFYGCGGLEKVYIHDLAAWCAIEFGDAQTDPLTNYYTGSNPLLYAHNLYYGGELVTDLVIPNDVKDVASCAFMYCASLTSVTIPDSVTTIGYAAFEQCTALTDVTIPDSVTQIGSRAFRYCNELTKATIGSGVEFIWLSAFEFCYKLAEVYNKSDITLTPGSSENGYAAYYAKNVYTQEGGSWLTDTADGYRFLYDGSKGYLLGYSGTEKELVLPNSFAARNGATVTEYEIYPYALANRTSLTGVTIPDGVTGIGDSAFSSCSALTDVTIGSGVESIGQSAFEYCNSLTGVTIPDSVTSIGQSAFRYCTALTDVTIPDSVTSIGMQAFFGCTALTSVTFENTTGWRRTSSSTATSGTELSSADLADPATAADYLTDAFARYYWKRG